MADHGALVAARYRIARSPRWKAVQAAHLERQPYCVACGPRSHRRTRKEVHHIFPFHYCVVLGRPDLELDPRNLITLCSSGPNHHLLLGHLDDFESGNLSVARDARHRFHAMSGSQIRSLREWELSALMRLPHLGVMSARDADRLELEMKVRYGGGASSLMPYAQKWPQSVRAPPSGDVLATKPL